MPDEIRNVLVGTDLKPSSDRAIHVAAGLARRTGARLHVLHVVQPPIRPALRMLDGATGGGGRSEAGPAPAIQAVEAQLERVVPEGRPLSPALVEAPSAADAICAHASELSADLIVIGEPGEGDPASATPGSTMDGVVRQAAAPVLIAREAPSAPSSDALIALDPADAPARLLETALRWVAALGGARVPDAPPRSEAVYVLIERATGAMPFDRAVVLRPEGGGAGPVHPGHAEGGLLREIVLWGEKVPDTILAHARVTRPQVLVAGSHGRGALGRALVGGTSAALARTAPCSVLLLPASMWADQG